jgi:hypothetical protein
MDLKLLSQLTPVLELIRNGGTPEDVGDWLDELETLAPDQYEELEEWILLELNYLGEAMEDRFWNLEDGDRWYFFIKQHVL